MSNDSTFSSKNQLPSPSTPPKHTQHQDLWVFLPVFGLVLFFCKTNFISSMKWKVLASLPEDGTASHPTWQTGENLLCSFILQSPSKTCFLHFLTASLTSFDPSTPSQSVGILVSECTITLVLPTSLYTEKQHENIANC